MPSTLQVDKIIDGSATTNKELAEYSSGNWSWGSGVPSGSILKVFHDEHVFTSAQNVDTSGIVWSDLELDISGVSTSDSMLVQFILPDVYNNATFNRRLKVRVVYSTDSFSSHQAQFGSVQDIYQDHGQTNQSHVFVMEATGIVKMTNPETAYKVRLNLIAQTGTMTIATSNTGLATMVGYNIKA